MFLFLFVFVWKVLKNMLKWKVVHSFYAPFNFCVMIVWEGQWPILEIFFWFLNSCSNIHPCQVNTTKMDKESIYRDIPDPCKAAYRAFSEIQRNLLYLIQKKVFRLSVEISRVWSVPYPLIRLHKKFLGLPLWKYLYINPFFPLLLPPLPSPPIYISELKNTFACKGQEYFN